MIIRAFKRIAVKPIVFRVGCFLSLLLLLCTAGHAQESTPAEALRVKFRSRGLFDLGYIHQPGANGRVTPYISDLRMGAKLSQGAWYFKLDVGLSGSKISIKDMLFNYDYGKGSFTLGNAYEPFHMDMITSSVDLSFNESVSSGQSFANGRRFGATYYLRLPHYFGAAGLYSDHSINSLFEPQTISPAMAFTTRHLYRQKWEGGNRFQLGGAFSFRTVGNREDDPKAGLVSLSSAGFSGVAGEEIISLKVDKARHILKANVEALGVIERWKIQGEATGFYVNRQAAQPNYRAYGGYLQVAYLFGRSTYDYDEEVAVPIHPTTRGVELVARLDYVQTNHRQSRLYGGEHTDLSLGVNYYFGRHFAGKFNVNHTLSRTSGTTEGLTPNDFLATLRLQYSF